MASYSVLLLFVIVLACHLTLAAERTFELNITTGSINPDCYDRGYTGVLVNGQFPAPPIRVTKNDHVHIIIRNDISSNHSTTIHYHGILQQGTCHADGVPGVTQRPIEPGEEYHQRFQVTGQAGTFYYHAHVNLQDDTVSGPFIVYDSEDAWPVPSKKIKDGPYEYDDERVLFLSEWWHQTEEQRMDYIMGTQYRGMDGADSYLINGKAVYGNSSSCTYPTIDVEANKVYRLRVIGGLTLSVLGVSIARHNLTIIEVDGELIQPYSVSYLEVSPGQRFSVLLSTDQPPESYYIDTTPYYIREKEGNGRAILRYKTELPETKAIIDELPPFPDVPRPQWYFDQMAPLESHYDFNLEADRTIVIKPLEKLLPDNTTHWFMNGRLLDMSNDKPPMLEKIQELRRQDIMTQDLSADGYDSTLGAFRANYNETVDLVIHTTTLPGIGVCVAHPWHTHGHVHYVLAHGPGEYVHERDKDLRTYQTSVARDTTLVYPVQPGPPPKVPNNTLCGWTKIRLYTTNPGAWAIHCHVTSHMLQGMMTVLVSGAEQL
ncbi:Cupredoxin [Fennellomyces sp. T-0311]|nr:Cupredoxin [Fennellomyces sp. T-0311]